MRQQLAVVHAANGDIAFDQNQLGIIMPAAQAPWIIDLVFECFFAFGHIGKTPEEGVDADARGTGPMRSVREILVA